MSEHIIWTMDSEYCDNCGVYLFDGGITDDNSGLCSYCFDQWLAEQTEDEYDPLDWYNPDDDEEEPTIGTPEEAHAVALSLTEEDRERLESEMEGGTAS